MRAIRLFMAFVVLAVSGCVSMPLSPAEAVSASLAAPPRPGIARLPGEHGKPPVALNLAAFGPDGSGDVFDGGEYNAILSQLVGPKAEVRLADPPRHEGSPKDELDAYRAGDRMGGNLNYRSSPLNALNLGKASLDGALMVMPYADLFDFGPENGKQASDPGRFIEQIVTALKPGGVLMVIDQKPAPRSGDDEARQLRGGETRSAVDRIKAHGVDFIGSVPALSYPEDAGGVQASDAAARDKASSDRVIDLFRKPEVPEKKQ